MSKLPGEQQTDATNKGQLDLEEKMGIEHNPKNQVTGCQVEGLQEGWAKVAFGSRKAHYFKNVTAQTMPFIFKGVRTSFYNTLCGLKEVGVHQHGNPMFHPGTYKKCAKCLASYKRLNITPPTEEPIDV